MSKNTIVFADPVCPKPYTGNTLRTEAMGGSEATVVRVAERLAKDGFDVTVCQHNRTDLETVEGVKYQAELPENAGAIIVLRSLPALYEIREHYPHHAYTPMVLWCHDIPGKEFYQIPDILAHNVTVVAVSNYHQHLIKEAVIKNREFKGPLNLRHIYNPVDQDLVPDETPVDNNKMVFFSSPHKGLDYTLKIFSAFESFEELKGTKLYISNPGYFETLDTEGFPNVINLDKLPNHEVIKHVREAFCVLHLNYTFPETFGIVYAEAQAVGTPYLTHPLGGVLELTYHPNCIIDVRNVEDVIDRLRVWKKHGRPIVRLKKKFRMDEVARSWHNLLRGLDVRPIT